MSFEQSIAKRRRDFRASLEAKAVPDHGIDLRRGAVVLPLTEQAMIRHVPASHEILFSEVAKACGVSVADMFADLEGQSARQARDISAALLVRISAYELSKAAAVMGVLPDTVHDALVICDAIWRTYSITSAAPMPSIVALTARCWKADTGGHYLYRIDQIQRAVARAFDVSMTDLLSSRRTTNLVVPRQLAMALAKTLTRKSLPEIGRRFSGRDHTTVLHAIRKMAPVTIQIMNELGQDAPVDAYAVRGRDIIQNGPRSSTEAIAS